MRQTDFQHEVLFYDGPDEFLAGAVPYLRAAIEAGERTLVAVGAAHTVALKAELGEEGAAVRFAPMAEVGLNPARIIPFWREFVDAHAAPDRPVRGIGEPVWAGRTDHELDECQRHETLLNLAFEDIAPWSLLCPYDTRTLADDVLEEARRCHPFTLSGGAVEPNAACDGEVAPAGVFGGSLPPRPARAARLDFDRDGLAGVRALVGAEAEASGLERSAAADLVAAASELAANSVAYGGGHGTIWAWREDGDAVVEVADAGLIEEPLVGRRKPLPAQDGGRGLWLANLLCDLVQIRSGPAGTTVRLRMRQMR